MGQYARTLRKRDAEIGGVQDRETPHSMLICPRLIPARRSAVDGSRRFPEKGSNEARFLHSPGEGGLGTQGGWDRSAVLHGETVSPLKTL